MSKCDHFWEQIDAAFVTCLKCGAKCGTYRALEDLQAQQQAVTDDFDEWWHSKKNYIYGNAYEIAKQAWADSQLSHPVVTDEPDIDDWLAKARKQGVFILSKEDIFKAGWHSHRAALQGSSDNGE